MKTILSVILLFLLLGGCADTVNNSNPASADIKIDITYPVSGDSIGYRGEKIRYDLKTAGGIIFIELYVNDEFVRNFPPVNNEKPEISFDIDSVLSGTKAEIYLIYYDKNGSSIKSNIVNNLLITDDKSLPTAPFNVNVVSITSTTLNISWQDTSRYILEYEIWRRAGIEGNFIKHLTADANARNINDNGITEGISYFYKIRGYSKNGYSGFSEIKSSDGSGSDALPAPGNLTTAVKDFRVIRLEWQDKSSNENYFKIQRRREWNFFETIGYTEKNVENFTDSSSEISGGSEYWYRVMAVSASDSSWSNEAYVFMPAYFLRTPSILSLTNTTSTKVSLKWRDNDNNYADFIIERKTGNSEYFEIGKTAAFVYTFSDTVHPGESYTYRVKQDDGIYASGYSEASEILTKIVELPSPQNLNGYYSGSDLVLNWEFGSEADKFVIERRDSTLGNSFTQLAVPSGTEREYTDYSTVCQHIYVYRIKAVDKYTTSGYSAEKVIKNWKACP